MSYRIHLLAMTGALALLANPAWAESLEEALASAYQSSPDLAAQQAAVRATDEDVSRALAGYRPTVTSDASLNRREIDDTRKADTLPGGRTETDYTTTDKAGSLGVTQPLFRGFRTSNSVKAADANVLAARERLRGTENATLLSSVQAFMDVVRDRAVLALNTNQVAVLRQQLKAAQDRFRVGEITRTDVAQSEARLAVSTANRIAAEATLAVSEEAYRRAIGRAPGTLDEPQGLPVVPESQDAAVEAALRSNPQLAAARLSEQVAGHNVATAKGAVLPSVQANAGVNISSGDTAFGSATSLATSNRTVKTVGASISIPLFQGGSEYSEVRRQQQLRSQRQQEILVAERDVIESARNAWEQLRSARAGIEASQSAVRANEIALEGVRQEQIVGSRTTLDVLDAEQELLDSRVTLVRARRNEVVAAYGLLAATGQLTAADLKLAVELYDPTQHYQRTRGRWVGWDD
jgi:outer membrane protein